MRYAAVGFLWLLAVLPWWGSQSVPPADVAAQSVNDDYVGVERMGSLTPEDRETRWFHENTLVVRKGEAILDMSPITIRRGRKTYSASDGGFLTYRGRFFTRGGRTFVALRLFQSDYVLLPKNGPDPYGRIKTLPVKVMSNEIDIDGVRYKRRVLNKTTRQRLLQWLAQEPLEKTTRTAEPSKK